MKGIKENIDKSDSFPSGKPSPPPPLVLDKPNCYILLMKQYEVRFEDEELDTRIQVVKADSLAEALYIFVNKYPTYKVLRVSEL